MKNSLEKDKRPKGVVFLGRQTGSKEVVVTEGYYGAAQWFINANVNFIVVP